MRRNLVLTFAAGLMALSACTTTTSSPTPAAAPQQSVARLSVSQATARLAPVKARMEPVAERECRRLTAGVNCDFLIKVDSRGDLPANAYQTIDKNGRPLIVFTAALVSDVQNNDELAFVLGHEAAHHLSGHIARAQRDAMAGAVIVGVLAAATGANAASIDAAMDVGAMVGSRTYSKAYELEADRLGTIITHKSGYDPVRGAAYFSRIPDPGNQFLGTHPPNAQRIEIVRKTAAAL